MVRCRWLLRPVISTVIRVVAFFSIIAIDTETLDRGLQAERGSSWPWRDGHVCGISAAWREGGEIRAIYVPMRHPDSENFAPAQVHLWLKDLITSDVRIACLNGTYDFGWLRAEGGVAMPSSERLEEVGALATMVNENLSKRSRACSAAS
jgi:hypothetical protein